MEKVYRVYIASRERPLSMTHSLVLHLKSLVVAIASLFVYDRPRAGPDPTYKPQSRTPTSRRPAHLFALSLSPPELTSYDSRRALNRQRW